MPLTFEQLMEQRRQELERQAAEQPQQDFQSKLGRAYSNIIGAGDVSGVKELREEQKARLGNLDQQIDTEEQVRKFRKDLEEKNPTSEASKKFRQQYKQLILSQAKSEGVDPNQIDLAFADTLSKEELGKINPMDFAKGGIKYRQELQKMRLESELRQKEEKAKGEKEDKVTDAQRNAATFAKNLMNSNEIIQNMSSTAASTMARGQKMLPKEFQSERFQKADQAQRTFINATLRRESGAAISPSEFENARQQYIPQPGDSQAVLAQKAENRATVLAGMKAAAGPRAIRELEAQLPAGAAGDIDFTKGLKF